MAAGPTDITSTDMENYIYRSTVIENLNNLPALLNESQYIRKKTKVPSTDLAFPL